MVNSYSLGKDSKFGNIDFSKLKSGITKQELGIQEGSILDSIWKRIDTNQEGDSKDKLDRQELNQFIKIISELCGKDTNLSTGEAKNFETEDGKKLGRKHKEELLTFLSKLSELTKGVAKVETETATNVETITYEDGHTEKVKPDGSKIIISKDGKTITEKDADGNTTKETVKTDDSETVTEYEPSSTNPKKQTKTNKDSKSVILYSQSKPIKQTTTIEKTGEVQEFDFVEDKPVLRKTTNPKTGETVVYSDGKPASRSITTKTEEGTRVSNTVYDGNDLTENVSINGKERYQKKVIDGREYEVSYDENGNTIGIIVQNGETIKSIADKFGVSVEDLIRANASKVKGKYPKAYFLVGEEIKIPRQMNADEKVLQGRKSASETRADYQRSVELQRQKAEEARMKKQTVIAKGKNGYYVTKDGYGTLRYFNANKKEISAKKFKEVCPIIYKNVTEKEAAAQRGATQRTRKKYDTATIQKEACELAKAIHNQISGASINENTINMLRGITPKNAAFVVSEYKRMYGVSLAKDIDDEWGLDLNTVKEHICKKLVDQAKQVGLKCSDYNKINNLSSLQNWINKVSEAIINKMPNATETYYATEAEESQRQQSAKNAKTAKASAEQIVNDLIKHTSGWNDVDKIKAAIARIDNPEELKEVNRLLTIKGYPPTDKYSPIENFIYQEANNSAVHTYNSSNYLEQVVHGWIDNGTLKGKDANEAQARMAARVLYDGGDGFGTDCDKIEKAVRMIKCPKPTGDKAKDKAQAREVYRFVNEMIKKHNTFYGLGSHCTDLLDYCKGEMWDSEVKYLNGILAETNAIQGNKKAQAIKDLTQEAVEGAGTNIEYLEQAIKGIDSPKDRKAVEAKLAAYCKKKGIKPQIQGQAYLQAILYDECDTFMGISTDHKEIRKFNEMLIEQGAYTEAEIVNLRAEQAALQILAGDFDNIKDAVEQIKDPKVLTKVKVLLKSKKYNSLDEFLSKKLNQTKSDLINAELASNNLLPNEKAADVAYRLMQNSAFDVRAMGVKAIRNEQVAKAVDAKFKQKGGSLAKFMEQFNKEKAEYKSKADFWDGWGKLGLGFIAEEISDAYKENTDSSDNMFVEMQSAQSLTPQQKSSYDMTVKLMEQKLAQMKKDYQAALDSQGAVSWAVNKFCEQYGIGTTREEIQARIEHDTETVRLLKLAAEGKLGKMVNGKTVAVTFEEVFKERNVRTKFDTAKVAKVQNQAEMLVAMNYAKTNIAVCWEELENGLTSSDSKCLSVAIIDTLDKLSQMTGQQLSLAGYGYTVKDGIILDSNGKSVSVDKLRALANKLKQGLSDVAKDLLGTGIPLNTSSSKIEGLLEDSYNKKKESFKQEFKNAFGQDCPDEMVEDYISTIETGKMVVNMGVLIGAVIAAPFTGGGSLAVFVAGAGASLGLNALEHSTDANGWTNAEWTSDMEQAFWDGALAAVGMKVGKYAEGFAQGTKVDSALMKNLLTKNTNMLSKVIKDPKKLQQATKLMTEMEASGYKMTLQMAEKMNPKNAAIVKRFIKNPENYKTAMIWVARAEAMGFEVSSDTLQSLVQMYCQEGKFNEEAFINGLIMSVAGNAAGHVAGTIGDVKGGKNTTPDVNPSAKQKQAPPSQDKPKYIVPEKETPFEKATRNGNNPNKVAPSGSVGKLGPEKFNAVKENLADELTQITSASDPHLETLQKRIDALHNREQRRELQNMLNNKKAELNANQPKVEGPKVDKNASVNAKQNTDTHVKNINDIKDMGNMRFNSVNETIEFFQYNGFEVEQLSGTYKRAWGNSIEYQCTAKDGNVIYQFSVKPDGTTEITGIKIGIGKKGNVTTDTTEKADKQKVEELKVDGEKFQAKQYSEMNENELFAEYQRLHQETTYGGLDNKTKAENIKKMKEINRELDAKGYSIEAGELKSKFKPNADKSSDSVDSDYNKTPLTLQDIEEIANTICKDMDSKDKQWIFDNLKYKEQIPILKTLLNIEYKYTGETKKLNSWNIQTLLSKLETIEDAQKLANEIKDRKYLYCAKDYFGTPYYNLAKKLYNNSDSHILKVLVKELDTPEKIKFAEEIAEKSKDIYSIYEKITGVNIRENMNRISSSLDAQYGDGTTSKYLESIKFLAMKAKTPLQQKAIVELMQFRDSKAFYYEPRNRYDISSLIIDVLDKVKTEDDVKIFKALTESYLNKEAIRIENGKEHYVLSSFKDYLEDSYTDNVAQKKYISFVIDQYIKSSSEYNTPLRIDMDLIKKANMIKDVKVVDLMKAVLQETDGRYYIHTFLEYSQDKNKLNAVEFLIEYNKNNNKPIRIMPESGEKGVIDYITDAASVDFLRNLATNYQLSTDSITYLQGKCTTNQQRKTADILLNYKNDKGELILSMNDIGEIIDRVLTDSEIVQLESILNSNKFGIFKQKLTAKQILDRLDRTISNTYLSRLKKEFPESKSFEMYLQYIHDDNDYNLLVKMLKNNVYDFDFIKLARENKEIGEAMNYILDNNPYRLLYLRHNLKDLSEMKNLVDKVKALNEAGIQKLDPDDHENFKKHKFYTDNYINDKKINNENYVRKYSSQTSTSQILKEVPMGEVLKIDNDLYVIDNNKLIKLNMKESTYKRLFPQGSRFASKQGALGDCWLVATIDGLLQSPVGRAKLLQLFEERNGNIYVKLPDCDELEFPNGKPLSSVEKTYFSKHAEACDGFKILEEAIGLKDARKKSVDIRSMADLDECMDRLIGGDEERAFSLIFGKDGNIPVISHKNLFEDIIEENVNRPQTILRTGINRNANLPTIAKENYGLIAGHAYRIDGYDLKNKIVYIVNPHDTKYRIELPLELYKECFSDIKIFNIDW